MAASVELTTEQFLSVLQGDRQGELPEGWWHWPSAHEAYRRLARNCIDHTPSCPRRFHGRGIVICAGGHEFFTNAFVAAKMLRHVGCLLPIQFWHLEEEVDEQMLAIARNIGAVCINASELARGEPSEPRNLHGWELKAFAILNAPYEDVLLLDADNAPVVDPTFLFETDEYERTGAIFWPDYGRLTHNRSIWQICEVAYRDEPEFETGQIVVSKQRCWNALQLAWHYNERSDFYYHHVHGDKETFHMAFRRIEQPYSMPSRGIHSLTATMCQHDFDGRRIFQHRNMDKWRLDGSNRRIDGFWFEDVCRYFLSELRAAWSGRVYWNQALSEEEKPVHRTIAGKRFCYTRVGYDSRNLEFRADGTIGDGAADCEQFWSVNTINGRVVLSILGAYGPTCHLTNNGGQWRGRWLRHERMPIELDRSPA